jgi:hypothetical protein
MKLAPIVLTVAQVQQLARVAATGAHPRERKRVQAVLSHSRGLTRCQLAAAYAADRHTVRAWLTRWPAPQTGPGRQKKVVAWVGAACQQVRRLVPRHLARTVRSAQRQHPAPRVAPGRLQLETDAPLAQNPARPPRFSRRSAAVSRPAPSRAAGRTRRVLRRRGALLVPGPRALCLAAARPAARGPAG